LPLGVGSLDFIHTYNYIASDKIRM
jgi:hypothetical protein